MSYTNGPLLIISRPSLASQDYIGSLSIAVLKVCAGFFDREQPCMRAIPWQPWTRCPCNGCKTSYTSCVLELHQDHQPARKQARNCHCAGRLNALQCELGGNGTSRLCLGALQDLLGRPVARPPFAHSGHSLQSNHPPSRSRPPFAQSVVHRTAGPALKPAQAPCCSWKTRRQITLHS